MIKPKPAIDIVYLCVLGASLLVAFYLHFSQSYVLTINYYAACLCWFIVSATKLIKFKKQFYGVLTLLFLATFDIINFTFFTVNADILHTDNGIAYNGVGINLIFLVLLIAYCFLNKDVILGLKKMLITGSDEEQKRKMDKMEVFYYEQFASCSEEELKVILKSFGDYPLEAQKALNRIKVERSFTNI